MTSCDIEPCVFLGSGGTFFIFFLRGGGVPNMSDGIISNNWCSKMHQLRSHIILSLLFLEKGGTFSPNKL